MIVWAFLAIFASYGFIGWCCFDFGYDRGWDDATLNKQQRKL